MKANSIAISSSKASFDEIYSMRDPRGYFSALGALDYMIPDVAAPIVRQLLEARTRRYAVEESQSLMSGPATESMRRFIDFPLHLQRSGGDIPATSWLC
jgi:hypothetical protein